MEKAIKDLRDWAIRADNNKFFRRAASMQKRLDKIDKIEKPVFEKPNMKLNIQNSERSGRDVVKVEDLTKGFENKLLFKKAELLIRYGENVFKKVRSLSGGEKSRLKLSELLYEDINLLILDEPTNHLDIDSIETLEEALEDFGGTILFVSHDRYFINKLCTRIVALENRGLTSYVGNYE